MRKNPLMMALAVAMLLALAFTASLVAAGTPASNGDQAATARVAAPASGVEEIILTKTVGTDSGSCAATNDILVAPGTQVYYCYTMQNNTSGELDLHTVVDDKLGVVFNGFLAVPAGGTAQVTATTSITTDTVNTAVWTADSAYVPPFADSDVATVTVELIVDLVLTKTVGTDPGSCAVTNEITVTVGDEVTYCYEVENTGTATLNVHDLSDSELGVIFAGLNLPLAPGATTFVTESTTIFTDTVNIGTWLAQTELGGDSAFDQDEAIVNVVPAPVAAIALTKTVGTDPGTCAVTDNITVLAGTEVTYCYTVENTGDLTLSLHDLDDSELGMLLDDFPLALAPGATASVTATAILTSTTANMAMWTAFEPGGTPLATAKDMAMVNVEPLAPDLELTKTVGTDPGTCAVTDDITVLAGTEVTYCYTVENTGNVTFNIHDLEDSELGVILTAFPFDLGPGETTFVTATATITTTTVNIATWVGSVIGGPQVGDSDGAVVQILPPPTYSIDLVKTVGTDSGSCAVTDVITVTAGSEVTYCYTVENTGSETFTLHDLSDSELGVILTNFPFVLAPGATVSVTATATINSDTTNTGFWTAHEDADGPSALASDDATVYVLPPSAAAIELTKTVGTDPASCAVTDSISVFAGTEVTYCFTVENTGLITLNLHDLVDSELGAILTNFPFVLAPGDSTFVTATATINVDTVNSAIWIASEDADGPSAVDDDDATVLILAPPAPGLSLEKTVETGGSCGPTDVITVTVGTEVTYCYDATNTGNVTFTIHDLVDNQLGTILSSFPFVLGPGESVEITAMAVITMSTLNVGTWTAFYDVAATRGNGVDGGGMLSVSDSDDALVVVGPFTLGIDLVKTVGTDPGACAASDAIASATPLEVTYCYTVFNTGNVTLSEHDLVDSELGTILDNFAFDLAPGASTFVTMTAMITESTNNIATWTGSVVPGGPSTADSDDATVIIGPITAVTLADVDVTSSPERTLLLLAAMAMLLVMGVSVRRRRDMR